MFEILKRIKIFKTENHITNRRANSYKHFNPRPKSFLIGQKIESILIWHAACIPMWMLYSNNQSEIKETKNLNYVLKKKKKNVLKLGLIQ